MYKMENYKLADKRKTNPKDLFDSMGRTEMAANLFRITQTEERIKNKNIHGQHELEKAHYEVGSEIRDVVISNTGVRPEQLPQEIPISEMKKSLKQAHKALKKKDR